MDAMGWFRWRRRDGWLRWPWRTRSQWYTCTTIVLECVRVSSRGRRWSRKPADWLRCALPAIAHAGPGHVVVQRCEVRLVRAQRARNAVGHRDQLPTGVHEAALRRGGEGWRAKDHQHDGRARRSPPCLRRPGQDVRWVSHCLASCRGVAQPQQGLSTTLSVWTMGAGSSDRGFCIRLTFPRQATNQLGATVLGGERPQPASQLPQLAAQPPLSWWHTPRTGTTL